MDARYGIDAPSCGALSRVFGAFLHTRKVDAGRKRPDPSSRGAKTESESLTPKVSFGAQM